MFSYCYSVLYLTLFVIFTRSNLQGLNQMYIFALRRTLIVNEIQFNLLRESTLYFSQISSAQLTINMLNHHTMLSLIKSPTSRKM